MSDNNNSTTSSMSELPSTITKETPTSTETTPLSDLDSHEDKVVECVAGQTLGYMLVRQPNITSVAYVGNPYLIRWDYTITVSKQPEYVDIYLQQVAPGVRVTWKNQIARNVTGRYFWWQPKGMLDGKYKIRIVPNGKETYNVKASEQPCFENGEAVPSVSSTFKMFNPKVSDIDSTSPLGKYDPYSAATTFHSVNLLLFFVLVLHLVIRY